jgi:8-oxo-dGTP pyrophosphatase MutT (NUDIX family)
MQLRDGGNGEVIPYPNMWNFPGGAMEEGEPADRTAVREIREEFELQLNSGDLVHLLTYAHDNINADHVFVCRIAEDAKPVLREGAEMQWLSLDEICRLSLAFAQGQLLPALKRHLENIRGRSR